MDNQTIDHTHSVDIHGAFSTRDMTTIGFGGTKRRVAKNVLVYAERVADGVRVQSLNDNFVPVGPRSVVSEEEFLANYTPEPEIFLNKVEPAIRRLEGHVARGDNHRENGRLYSAQHEYSQALSLHEEHVRATFGLGIVFLRRGEKEAAREVFRKILGLNAAYEQEHKHLFNEFGIRLRKAGMHEEALAYYSRALELQGDDDHLLYNMGRAYYELGRRDKAQDSISQALALNPDLEVGRAFMKYLSQRPAA